MPTLASPRALITDWDDTVPVAPDGRFTYHLEERCAWIIGCTCADGEVTNFAVAGIPASPALAAPRLILNGQTITGHASAPVTLHLRVVTPEGVAYLDAECASTMARAFTSSEGLSPALSELPPV